MSGSTFVNKEDPKCRAIKIKERQDLRFCPSPEVWPRAEDMSWGDIKLGVPTRKKLSHRKKLFSFLRHPGNKVEKQKPPMKGKKSSEKLQGLF